MKVIMHPATSLDGFIAKLDGDSDWVNPEDDARYENEVERCGCVLVGHTTYKQYEDDFLAKKNVTMFVCTTQSGLSDTTQVKFLTGSAQDMLDAIEQQGFSEIVVCGGGEINGLLASAGLVDEIVVSIYPLLLGEGIPLFGSHKPSLNLQLLSTNQDIEGIVQNHYKVIRDDQ